MLMMQITVLRAETMQKNNWKNKNGSCEPILTQPCGKEDVKIISSL